MSRYFISIIILALAILVSSASVYCHSDKGVVVYSSYEQYKLKKGDAYDEYVTWKSGASLVVKHNGNEEKVSSKNMWGFTYKNALFRICEIYNAPARLMSNKNIYYYENGLIHLTMLRDSVNSAQTNSGSLFYVSQTMQSEVLPIDYRSKATKSALKRFLKMFPQHKSIIACLASTTVGSYGHTCVE